MTNPTPEVQSKANPASPTPAVAAERRRRIPMSVPTRKLEVPEIPGYYLYWFREQNIPRALEAGYEYVTRKEVALNPTDVGSSRRMDGNTDLGDNVTLVSGVNEQGAAQQAVLMKLKQEFRDEDQKMIDARNEAILAAIFRGESVAKPGEALPTGGDNRYLKTALMNRPARKVKLVGPR